MTSSRAARGRDLGVDVARGVAVISMYVAHVAPSDGPGQVLLLSEFLTAPLFALLVGVGAELSAQRPRRSRAWRSALVRGGVLLGLGVWLASLPSQILIVLVWLGVLTWVMAGVARLPSALVAGIGALGLVAGPLWQRDVSAWWARSIDAYGGPDAPGVRVLGAVLDVVLINDAYRLVAFVGYACLGVLAVRHLRARAVPLAVTSLGAAAALFALDKVGGVPLDPYAGTWQETAFVAVLALATLAGSWVVADRWQGAPVEALARVGGMALTLYVLHVLATIAYLRTEPVSGRDDSWPLLAGLVIGSLALAWLWHLALGRTRFRRGPIEGLVGLATR